jgi:hypothetical protein
LSFPGDALLERPERNQSACRATGGFIAPDGIKVLLEARDALVAQHRSLVVACPQRLVARILGLTGAAERLSVYSSAGEAAAG